MTKNLDEGIDNMCNMGQALFEEGKIEGKIEGKAEGIEEGIKTTRLGDIVSLCKKLGCTIEYAMSLLSIPENMREEYKEMLEKEGLALA